MKIEYITAKSVVRLSKPSLFSWSEMYLNPYQGCFHDCKYCDGKSEFYHMHNDFAGLIKVKQNAPKLLKRFFEKKGFFPVHKKEQFAMYDFFPSLKDSEKTNIQPKFIVTVGGGVCDVYQPAEKKTKITRALLEIVYDYQFPVSILTKSDLVLRDLDLLEKINDESFASVNFTITLNDESVQKIFEPGASTTSERFAAIKKIREKGIQSGVYFYPALPFIGDTEDNVQAIYTQAKEAGAQYVYCWGLTLKPGRNKNEFMATIKEHYPELLPKYQKLYGNNSKYGHLDTEQFKALGLVRPEIKGFKYAYELGLDFTAPRFVPVGRIKTNLLASELLRKISQIQASYQHADKHEIRKIKRAIQYLEQCSRDIQTAPREDLLDMPIDKKILPIIIEFIEKQESSYYEGLKQETYESIIRKYYS